MDRGTPERRRRQNSYTSLAEVAAKWAIVHLLYNGGNTGGASGASGATGPHQRQASAEQTTQYQASELQHRIAANHVFRRVCIKEVQCGELVMIPFRAGWNVLGAPDPQFGSSSRSICT